MAGYLCQLCDGTDPAVQLHTSLETGATVALCATCLPVGLAGALATVLGVDPDGLYDAVTAILPGQDGQDQDGGPETASQDGPDADPSTAPAGTGTGEQS